MEGSGQNTDVAAADADVGASAAVTGATTDEQTMVKELEGEEEDEGVSESSDEEESVVMFSNNPAFMETFSLAELTGGTPEGVKPFEKEKYLADDDFLGVFGCVDRVASEAGAIAESPPSDSTTRQPPLPKTGSTRRSSPRIRNGRETR